MRRDLTWPSVVFAVASLTAACGHDAGRSSIDESDVLEKPSEVDLQLTDTMQMAADGFAVLDEGTDSGFRNCINNGDGSITVARRWGALELSDEDERVSIRRDEWTAGPYFGKADAARPNVGYTSRDGSIVNGAPLSKQPSAISCGEDNWSTIGWQFSNNVGWLTDAVFVDVKTRRPARTGERVTVRMRGERLITYVDPALDLTQPEPRVAYFDEAFAGGVGRSLITRRLDYGSADLPNRITVVTRAESGEERGRLAYDLHTDTLVPMFETIERQLSDGWPLVRRHLHSGVFIARHANGTEARTAVQEVVFERSDDDRPTCRPVSGKVITTIVPPTPGPRNAVVTVTREFDHGMVTHIECSATNVIDCQGQARQAMRRYGPPSCLY